MVVEYEGSLTLGGGRVQGGPSHAILFHQQHLVEFTHACVFMHEHRGKQSRYIFFHLKGIVVMGVMIKYGHI